MFLPELLSCSGCLLLALQQNRAQSRLLYLLNNKKTKIKKHVRLFTHSMNRVVALLQQSLSILAARYRYSTSLKAVLPIVIFGFLFLPARNKCNIVATFWIYFFRNLCIINFSLEKGYILNYLKDVEGDWTLRAQWKPMLRQLDVAELFWK